MGFIQCVLVLMLGAPIPLTMSALPQTPSTTAPSLSQPGFDVVSIRPMREGDTTRTHITNPAHDGYFKAVNVNLKALMEVAYDIPDLRMYRGPEWTSTQKFSLEANADPALDQRIAGLSSEQGKAVKRKMLAALLADRFKLRVHTETREMPIYAMVVAKGGPKLGESDSTLGSLPGAAERIVVEPGHDSLAILAYELSWRLGRPVIDRTGLQFTQRLTLGWSEDDGISGDRNDPSLFTAIHEQLGLRLDSTRAPVPVLVIDHAEQPSEN